MVPYAKGHFVMDAVPLVTKLVVHKHRLNDRSNWDGAARCGA